MFMHKYDKQLMGVGLIIVCICLILSISAILLSKGYNKDLKNDVPKASDSVEVNKITDNTKNTDSPKPVVTINGITQDNNTNNTELNTPTDNTDVTVPLTDIKQEKPTPPPTPEIKHDIENEGDIKVKPSNTPVKPKTKDSTKPSAGAVNEKGQTYVPGFGWVDNSGENRGGVSDSKGDINKQIGIMD